MNTKEFLNHFRSEKSKLEFTKISNGIIKVISEKEALQNKTDNIYFLGGIRKDFDYSNGKRAKDNDIIEKNYFVLDLDIAKNFEEEFGEKCSYDDIVGEAENLAEYLKDVDDLFGEFSFIVVSGGGIHIYYMGDFKEFIKEEYSLGVHRIYNQWNKIMGAKSFEVDFACRNIARILRLPGSINQKNGKECKIIYGEYKESKLFNLIKAFAIKEQEENEKANQIRKKEIEEELKKFNKNENTFYNEINLIPAYQIAELLIPNYPFDGKKNFKNNKGGFTGYFYNKETNSICNGGSKHFSYGDNTSCYNVFSLVKNFKGMSNKETFLFFKELLGNK